MLVMITDLETGGLNPNKHSVLSVGALVGNLDTGEILDKFEVFHKLPMSEYVYTPRAIEIHGVTPELAFAKGITTGEIRDKFTDMWLNNGITILGGHNVGFDVEFLASSIFKISTEEFRANFSYRFLDSLPIIKLFAGSEELDSGATLTKTTKALNIDMSDFGKNKFHTALFDAVCSFRILHKFRKVLTQPDVIERIKK